VKLLDLIKNSEVSFELGQLIVRPNSGEKVSEDFWNKDKDVITAEILSITGQDAFVFDYFSTGSYLPGRGKPRNDSMTINWLSLTKPEDDLYSIFNVGLKYLRNAGKNKKGDPFKGNKFIVKKRSSLLKLWYRTGLLVPKLSDFHRNMGNLKNIHFTGKSVHKIKLNKIDTRSIFPLNIAAKDILDGITNLSLDYPSSIPKASTIVIPKEKRTASANQDFEQYSSAGRLKYSKTVIQECSYTCDKSIDINRGELPIEGNDDEFVECYDDYASQVFK